MLIACLGRLGRTYYGYYHLRVDGPLAAESMRMKTFLVSCTKKHVVHGRIESIGCIDPTTSAEVRLTEADAIHQIETKAARFIVRDAKGNEAVVEVEERNGRKFMITKRDHATTDNLGALPECSSKPIVVPPPYRPVAPARSHSVRGDWKAS